jgi:hypothetical protein
MVPRGVHGYRFYGRDRTGDPLASGVYYYRVTAGRSQQSRKMVVLR